MNIFQTKNAEAGFNFANAVAFEVFSSVAVSSTTSTTFQDKLTGTTQEIAEGTYVICWYAELTNSGNNNLNEFRVDYKKTTDATFIEACQLETLITRADAYEVMSGFRVFAITGEDTIDFRVSYRRIDATARIRNTNVYIFRIAA
jgi:hypothetical protein